MSIDDNRSLWRQLPGNVWHPVNGDIAAHTMAMDVTDTEVDRALAEGRLPEWSGGFVKSALYAAITRQSSRNSDNASIKNPPVDNPTWQEMLDGDAWPHQLVRLKKQLGVMGLGIGYGLETARHTHVGVNDTEDTIDSPVRRDLVNDRDIDTWLIEGQPYFKLKYDDPSGEIIERKRLVATHYGNPYRNDEQLWTMRRDMMLIDFVAIRELLGDDINNANEELSPAQQEARVLMTEIRKTTKNSEDRDYEQRSDHMNAVLEPILDRPLDQRPSYIIQLLTTMYLKEPTDITGSQIAN